MSNADTSKKVNLTYINPIPVEEDASLDFVLTLNGAPAPLHRARVSAHPLNQVWPGYQRPKSQTELASFASWDQTGPVEVVAVSARPVQTVQVRPAASGIVPEVEGDTIRFTVARPGQYTLEVNGSAQALHLFANPPEENIPDPDDPTVRYFGPGVHCPGLIRLESGQTLYLAAGAVVYGAILAEKAENIVIRGRGILDGSKIDRLDGLTALTCLYACRNVRIEGITLRDSPVFTLVPLASSQVRIRNVKIIGNWRYNSDGINFISCHDCLVENSFIRTFDDCICLKGYENFGPVLYRLQLVNGQWDGCFTLDGVTRRTFTDLVRSECVYQCATASIHDIRIQSCVLWNDWGRALELGAETAVDEIRDILFEDCDIIHVSDVAMDVQNCDRALVRNIVFRDIRVEMDDGPRRLMLQTQPDQRYTASSDGHLPTLIVLENKKGYCSFDTERGRIRDVHFENIAVTAPAMPPSRLTGCDASHSVEGVTITNLRLNDLPVAGLEAGCFTLNEFVRDVTLQPAPAKAGRRVLFLGNSITRHPPKEDIGWMPNWGMAATTREQDYVHVLLRRMTAAAGGTPPVARIENIVDFEQEYALRDFTARFAELADFRPDTVILAIGENVAALATEQDQARFRDAVSTLLAHMMKNASPALVVRSCFWPDPAKDAALRQACADAGGTFVDISSLAADEKNYARAERRFAHDGVAAHPGDTGMAAIADALWTAITTRNEFKETK
jgi:hypothetical protein